MTYVALTTATRTISIVLSNDNAALAPGVDASRKKSLSKRPMLQRATKATSLMVATITSIQLVRPKHLLGALDASVPKYPKTELSNRYGYACVEY